MDFNWVEYLRRYEDLSSYKTEEAARAHYLTYGIKENRFGGSDRSYLASRYLSGFGIEIGALNKPLWVPPAVQVLYVDRLSNEGLKEHYPECDSAHFVKVGLVDDGEKLGKVLNGSLNFIIANHFLEHTENFLGTLKNHLAKLRVGGILYAAVPDKRFTFDKPREMTTFEHLYQDSLDNGAASRVTHYREWVVQVNGPLRNNTPTPAKVQEVQKEAEVQVQKEMEHLMKMNYSIHFHCWDYTRFVEILLRTQRYFKYQGIYFDIAECIESGEEIITVLRKTTN